MHIDLQSLRGTLCISFLLSPCWLLSGCYLFHTDYAAAPGTEWKAPAELADSLRPTPTPSPESTPAEAAPILENEKPYSLSTAIDTALLKSPRTQAAWERARAANAAKGYAYSELYPAVDGSLFLSRSRIDFAGNPSLIYRTVSSPAAELTYTLIDFGDRSGKIKTATNNLIAANLQYNRALQEVIFAAEVGYFNFYAAKAQVTSSEASLKDAQENARAAKERYEVGLNPKQDFLLSESNLRKAEFDLEQARAAVEDARAVFARTIGVPVTNRIDIEEPDFSTLKVLGGDTLSSRVEGAFRNRPDLLASYATIKSFEGAHTSIIGKALPKIVTRMDGSIGDIRNVDEDERNWSAGVGIEIPIFSGFSNLYAAREAAAQVKEAEHNAKAQELQVAGEVWRDFFGFEASERQLHSAEALLRSTEESFRSVDEGYRAGASSVLDLLSSQRELSNARRTLVSAKANFAISIARLAYSSGELQPIQGESK